MQKFRRIILYLLVNAALAAWPTLGPCQTGGLRVIYPPDRIVTTVNPVRIIGSSDGEESLRILSLKTGSSREFPLKTSGGYFSQRVSLQPGLNTIKVLSRGKPPAILRIILTGPGGKRPEKGYRNYSLHPGDDQTEDCLGCHPADQEGKPVFRRLAQKVSCSTDSCHPNMNVGRARFQHGPVSEGNCAECHNPHGSTNPRMLKAVRAKLCFSCHNDLETEFDRKFQHFPVKNGDCLACHDPHQSDLEFHLKRGSIKELCAGCHGSRLTDYPEMHTPAEAGDCTACHNPHVSENRNLLYEDGNKMCFSCHKVRKREFSRKHVHEPVRKACTICHDPHGSVTQKHLRTRLDENGRYIPGQSVKDSCLVCHKKLNPLVADAIENAPVPHRPVAEGKCLLCHTPHSTNYKKQLNRPLKEICFSCHREMKSFLSARRFQHGPVRTGNCEQCHQVHGSNRRMLLVNRFDGGYSGNFAAARFALCFNCHSEKVFTDEKNMETNFRFADLNLHYFHVNKDDGLGCKTCHEIHASTQNDHIREEARFKENYRVKIRYKSLRNGGRCVVDCHMPRQYDRKRKIMG